MAINKKLIHFKKYEDFNSKKLSADENNTTYTIGIEGGVVAGEPEIKYNSICWIKDVRKMWTHGTIYNCSDPDLAQYLTKEEIANLYATKSSLSKVATSGSYNDLSNKPNIPSPVSESTVNGWGFTKNEGTITGIKMNGSSKGTSGVVDLGTVITAHQDISGKLDATVASATYLSKEDASGTYLSKTEANDTFLGKTAKASSATKADSATSATKATQDANGNIITNTYATKSEVNAKYTKPTTGIPASDLADNYVTETELGSKGYATTSSVSSSISSIQSQIDTLVSGNASEAIESFNEITAFLEGVEDTETLEGIIAGIETQISGKASKSDSIKDITRNGTTFTATRADGTTFTFTQQDTNTKVTSVGNHYVPSANADSAISVDASSSTAASWGSTSLVTGVNLQRDAAGHVTGMTVDSIKMPSNPNTNTTYTFAGGTGGFTVTPSGGTAQTVSIGKPSTAGTADKAKQLNTAYSIDGVNFNGTADITHFGECSTAAATVAKTVSVTGFELVTGARVTVKFTVTNTAASPTLNVNGTGAKSIMYRGSAISAGYLAANRVYEFVYDGTDYELVGDINTDSDTKYNAGNGLTLSSTTFNVGAGAGISVEADTVGLAVSGVTAGTYGDDEATRTLTHSDVFDVPQITVDAYGRVTSASTKTLTLPASGNTDTKVTSVGNHYTPAEDTSAAISAASGTTINITGSSGKLNVVTGLKRDAKGHIVGVTSANIYSTDNDTTYSSKTASSGGTDVSLVTTGEKYTWNSKASTSVATTSANGLMSKSDKSKLDGIASGATANVGTITGIKMNGSSKGTSGVVDLGTVITAHQDISGKLDKTTAASTYATKTEVSSKVEGDGTITKIVKVTALPSSPDANTLYIIVEE